MANPFPEPTVEQCAINERIEHGERTYYAAWYPQMGGYVGKCLIEFEGGPSCFGVYVWHDGDFPFGEGAPVELHHCDPEQFIDFGEEVLSIFKRHGESTDG